MFQQMLKMKKIINNIVLISVAFLALSSASCGNKKEEKVKALTTEEIIQQVDTVVAIGKVSAEEGTALITSNTAARIKEILIKEGDSVSKGAALIRLANTLGTLDVDLAKNKRRTVQDQNYITQSDLEREKISLAQLEEKYKTSKALYEKQAETKENYLNDQSNFMQQKQRVTALQQQLQVNKTQLQEQQLYINKSEVAVADYTITAPQAGIITNLLAQIGQNVNSSESLGEIIDTQKIVIEAEVDELFADKIAVGQQVTFININTKQNLGNGEIIYASPTLMNKSILYETANEADDRRVLRIKIKPSSGQHLLINAKVECQIKIK